MARLRGERGDAAEILRAFHGLEGAAPDDHGASARLDDYRRTALDVVARQRTVLDRLRDDHRIGMDDYYLLQEEIDWREMTLLPADKRKIEES